MPATQPAAQRGDDSSRARRRRRLLGDLVVFQIKLVLEGFKDIFLGPISIAAVILDLLTGKDAPERYFDGVLRLGQRYEDWLDLYGSRRRLDAHRSGSQHGLEAEIQVVQTTRVTAVDSPANARESRP